MKTKFLTLILAILVVVCALCFIACGGDDKGDATPDIHTHNYTSAVTEPTCTEKGYTTFTCECGDSYVDDYVDARHTVKITKPAVKPTCTDTGLTAEKICLACNMLLQSQEEIPVLGGGHSFTKYNTDNNATLTADGTKTAVCDRCGETDTVSDLGSHLMGIILADKGSYYEVTNCDTSRTIVSLPSIYNEKPIMSIGDYAFINCNSLQSITISNSVTSIGANAFFNLSSLKIVTFGKNSKLESVGDYTFSNCSSLESITIPSSVTSIDTYAFSNCSSLESITFEANSELKSIGASAFSNLSSLKIVTFGKNSKLESIGYEAFYDCDSLESITIPSGVASIGRRAFRNCSSLTSITFEDVNGWHYNSNNSYVSGTPITLGTASENATMLKSLYGDLYWYKTEE